MRIPPEVLAQKSHKWVQMQNKRYGEKRKAGFIDTGKQVSSGGRGRDAQLTMCLGSSA